MSGFEQSQQIRTAQQQSVILSARQQLGVELLALPLLKLEEALQNELLSNPVLEELTPENPVLPEEMPAGAPERDEDDYESGFEAELARQEQWANELPLPLADGASESDRKAELLSNSPAPLPSLRDMLMVEAETAGVPEYLKQPVFEIISSLDPDGFLTVPLADLMMCCVLENGMTELDISDMKQALEIVSRLAPPGVWIGYRSDYLKLELEKAGKLDADMAALCDALENLPDDPDGCKEEKQYLELLSARLNLSESKIKSMLAVLHELELPAFSSVFSEKETEFINPELEITLLPDGTLHVAQIRGIRRMFGVSPVYEKMLEERTLDKDDRKYLSEKIIRARNFIDALAMRDSTLLRLGELIAQRQHEFFIRGVEALKTFTMSEAASIMGYDTSTISRAVQNKYVRTPQGVFPLRFFFPGGGSVIGENRSQMAIMEDIKRIIDNENPALPLSDEQITRQLNKNGVAIERRTVAKYRGLLNIPPASKRKS